MKNRKLKRRMRMSELGNAAPPQVPIPREDRLSAIVPIDRICVEDEIKNTSSFETLCESVKRNGVLQPLLLRRICDESSSFGGLYLLIAGKKRLAAAKAAGHRAVPCYIVSMDAKDAAISSFLTDVDFASKDMFDQSDAVYELKKRFGMTIDEISLRIGRTKMYVAGKLILQRYSEAERGYLRENLISEDKALALLQIQDENLRCNVMRQVCEKKMSLKMTLDYVRSVLSGSLPSKKNAMQDLRFFYNSVDRLMVALRRSGADAELEQCESMDETVVTIRVKHSEAD